jgi:hypothetical protein
MSSISDAPSGPCGSAGRGWGRHEGWRAHSCGYGLRWRPLELAAVILGFIVFWPIGLAFLGWKIWQKKIQHTGDFAGFAEATWRAAAGGFERAARGERWRPFANGNSAFEEWRATEFARLEEERRKLDEAHREFSEFMNDLRRAKDREEFERFMAARRARQAGSQEPPRSAQPENPST